MTAIASDQRPAAYRLWPTSSARPPRAYCAKWAGPLCRALRVDRRELRRWMAANPANPVTHDALVSLRDLLTARATFDARRFAERVQKILDEDKD